MTEHPNDALEGGALKSLLRDALLERETPTSRARLAATPMTAPLHDPVFVARPSLPPFEDVRPYLEEIWRNRRLTNGGPILRRFEAALAERLRTPHVSVVANATLGLMLGLRRFGVTGEVLTTPFTFVATANAIRWAGAEPVFVDIDPQTLNLDPGEVERRAGPRTSAVVATHCFGVPCDVVGLRRVADRLGVPLLFDAAHAFGVTLNGESLLSHGDLSVVSLHATKVFHSCEGGVIVSPDAESKQAIERMANHGFIDEATVHCAGLNAKMSELHAAIGLAGLAHASAEMSARAAIARRYADALADVPGLRCICPPDAPGSNFYAFPILVGDDYPLSRDALTEKLRARNVFARKYFWPLVSDFDIYRDAASGPLPHARAASDRILCLPLYADLELKAQETVIDTLRSA